MIAPEEKQNPESPPAFAVNTKTSLPVKILILFLFLLGLSQLIFRTIPRTLTDSADFAVYYCTGRAWVMGENPYYWQFIVRDNFDSDPTRVFHKDEKQRLARPCGGNCQEYADFPDWIGEIPSPPPITYYTGGAPMDLLDDAMTPPPALPLMGLFGTNSWQKAKILWLSVNILLLFLSIVGLAKLAAIKLSSATCLIMFAGVLCLAPVHTCLGLGQLVIAAVAFAVWAEIWLRGGKNIRAAIAMSVAIALKPQLAGLLLVWWLFRRRWFAVAGTAVILGLLSGLAIWWMGRHNGQWLGDLQANINQFFHGGRGDFTAQPVGYQFLNLEYPLYLILGDLDIARAAAWLICLCLGAALIYFSRRSRGSLETLDELAIIGAIGIISLLTVYNRLYGAVWLVVPLAWGICQWFKGRRIGMAVCLLCVPFLLPGPSILNYLAVEGYVGRAVAENPLWKIVLVPHQIYLLMAILCCLIWSLRSPAEKIEMKITKSTGT